jgi:hypothetical protein
MFSDEGLITKSLGDMRQEIESFLADAARLRAEYDAALDRINKLRIESIEARQSDPETAELLWAEAEDLQNDSKEMLRLSIEKTLKAGEIKHRLDIRAQIEAIDGSDETWKKAVQAGRS